MKAEDSSQVVGVEAREGVDGEFPVTSVPMVGQVRSNSGCDGTFQMPLHQCLDQRQMCCKRRGGVGARVNACILGRVCAFIDRNSEGLGQKSRV